MTTDAVASVALKLRSSEATRDLKKFQAELQKFSKDQGSAVKRGAQAAVGGLAAFGTASGIQDAASEAIRFEEMLTRIGIQAGGNANLGELRTQAASLGKEFGLSKLEVLSAMNALVDLQGVSGVSAEKMRMLTQAAVATGAPVEDLAGVAFALENAFHFKNAQEAERAMSAVIQAGKDGAVPLNQMSTVLQQLSVMFSRVSGSGVEGAAQLSAAMQVAREGFGSPAEAATGMKALISQLETSATALAHYGVEVKTTGADGKKEMRPLLDVLDDIEKKGLQHKAVFTQLFGSAEARQMVRVLIDGRAKLDQLTESAVKSNSVQEDSASFMASNAGQMRKSLAEVKAAFVDAFTPERLKSMTDALGVVAKVTGFVIENLHSVLAAILAIKAVQGAMIFSKMASAAAAVGVATDTAAREMRGLSSSVTAVGTAANGLSKLDRLAGIAGPLSAAALAGWELGRALDGAIGASDKLGDAMLAIFGTEDEANKKSMMKRSNVMDRLQATGITKNRVVSQEMMASLGSKFGQDVGTLLENPEALQSAIAIREQWGMITKDDKDTLQALMAGDVLTPNQAAAKKTSEGLAAAGRGALFSAQRGGIAKGVLATAQDGEVQQSSIDQEFQRRGFGRGTADETAAILAELRSMNQELKKKNRLSLMIDGKNVLEAVDGSHEQTRSPPR